MEFLWSTQSQSSSSHENTDHDQELARMDDDMFYAELKRQVLRLIDEDSEDFAETRHSKFIDYGCKREPIGLNTSFSTISRPGSRFSLWDKEIKNSAPTWLVKTWRTGNGTGVFIPQIVKTRSRTHGPISYARRQSQKHGGLLIA